MDNYDLHAVIISRTIPINDAIRISKKFIPSNRNYYRETKNSYRFRNIPKTKFYKNTLKTKKINENISLVYGKLK